MADDVEAGLAGRVSDVADLEPEAQVGLVGPVAQHRVRVREPREGRLELGADALAPDGADHRFHQREDELNVRERHLDVELRQFLDAVRA